MDKDLVEQLQLERHDSLCNVYSVSLICDCTRRARIKAVAAIEGLQVRLEQAEKDKARLDWLDSSGFLLGRNFDGDVEIVAYGVKNIIGRDENPLLHKTVGKAPALREAIDFAVALVDAAQADFHKAVPSDSRCESPPESATPVPQNAEPSVRSSGGFRALGAADPCPFCGGTHISVCEGSGFRWLVAGCDECGAKAGEVRCQTMGEGTKEQWWARAEIDAIAAWNTRVDIRTAAQTGVRSNGKEGVQEPTREDKA